MRTVEQTRAAMSVVEVAALCSLSPSRFHALVKDGFFPKSVSAQGKRPCYPNQLVQRCIEIRKTGIGENGAVITFNRKLSNRKHRTTKQNVTGSSHQDLISALAQLGIDASDQVVQAALNSIFPGGTDGVSPSEITRKTFLFLKKSNPAK